MNGQSALAALSMFSLLAALSIAEVSLILGFRLVAGFGFDFLFDSKKSHVW